MTSVTFGEIASVMTAVGLLVGGAWALVKFAARQFDQKLEVRFAAQEKIRQEARTAYEQRLVRLEDAERDYKNFKVEVHRDFVRREDHTHDIAMIKTMIDNLALNVDRKLTEIWQEMRGRQ